MHSCLAALPPWTGLPLKIVLAPETISRDSNPPIVQSEFSSFLTNYSTALTFYTDGSVQNNLVGCAVFFKNGTTRCSLPPEFSILSAELYAIYLAMDLIKANQETTSSFLIVTDSLSAVASIQNYQSPSLHPIGKDILTLAASMPNYIITLAWFPGHKGIKGNDIADKAAKEALTAFPLPNIPIPLPDARRLLSSSFARRWQHKWTLQGHYHLLKLKPTIEPWQTDISNLRRRLQVVLNRVHLGHSLLTHSHLFRREPRPSCPFCSQPGLSMLHLLRDCSKLQKLRQTSLKRFASASLTDDSPASINALFHFLSTTTLFNRI